MTGVLVASTVAAWGMVGLIWMVQIVHYPMLVHYSAAVPVSAARDHAHRISFVVGPLMAVEGVTALMLLGWRPDAIGWFSAWLAAALLGVALLSTVLVQVPLHTIERHHIDQNVVEAAGLSSPSGPVHARYSPGVTVNVSWLETVAR